MVCARAGAAAHTNPVSGYKHVQLCMGCQDFQARPPGWLATVTRTQEGFEQRLDCMQANNTGEDKQQATTLYTHSWGKAPQLTKGNVLQSNSDGLYKRSPAGLLSKLWTNFKQQTQPAAQFLPPSAPACLVLVPRVCNHAKRTNQNSR